MIDVASSELIRLITACEEADVPYTILGNGSNVLVGDKGIRGVTIIIGKRMADITVDEESHIITAEAGALLSKVAHTALEHSLTGMEQLAGIPGSIGGAVLMNAGAYGGEVKDILVDAQIYTPDGAVEVYTADELDLSYRHSRIMDEGGVILSARFKLTEGNQEDIKQTMTELSAKRNSKQPLNYPSAGSTFKRPTGYFAGQLIQEAGLMGYRVGGAMVSKKHAGFVINYDNATAADVRQLMQDVHDAVLRNDAVKLEPEVRFIGEF